LTASSNVIQPPKAVIFIVNRKNLAFRKTNPILDPFAEVIQYFYDLLPQMWLYLLMIC